MDKARKIESLGYDTLVVPDHLADFLAPVPALISAADATNQLRIGTNVINNDYRHPVLLAREAATIDLLTDARFQLGLGAGNVPSEYHQAGMKFDAGATRVARFRRDGPDLSAWKATEIDARIRLVRAAAGADRYGRLEINALVQRVIVTDCRQQATDKLATRWPQLNADEILQCPFVLVGSVDQLIEELIANRDRWDISSYAIFEADIESFAPVVARLAGK